jgi:hypothetical protein
MEPMLRVAVTACLAFWAGCVFTASEDGADLAPDDDVQGDLGCAVDSDCTLAGPSCCECPTFAVRADSGWDETCEAVHCPTPTSCPAFVARCDRGVCTAACAPTACDISCPTGFAVDAAGCTTCECANGGAPSSCQVDTDCVRVPADCCGCDRGGTDTAVPASVRDDYVNGLGCTGNESCPGVSTCNPGDAPHCSGGQCVLGGGAAPPPPPGECGRPDLPPCPDGLVCVINAMDSEAGTGRCEPP